MSHEPPHAACDPFATPDDPEYCSICSEHKPRPTYSRTGPCDIVGCQRMQCSTKDVTADVYDLMDLLASETDDDSCDFDHNNSCQTHGSFFLEPGELCHNERAKRLLARMGHEDG